MRKKDLLRRPDVVGIDTSSSEQGKIKERSKEAEACGHFQCPISGVDVRLYFRQKPAKKSTRVTSPHQIRKDSATFIYFLRLGEKIEMGART